MQPELPAQQQINKNSHKGQSIAKWTVIEKLKRSDGPKGRYNHISFFYKGCIYIHGGATSQIKQLDCENQSIYRFNLAQNKWEKQMINSANKTYCDALSSHCGVVIPQKGDLVIFGGSNSKGQCKNDLWVLNLQNLSLKKVEQKAQNGHQIPSARESASMLLYREKFIVLYGGINLNTDQIYNDINIFHWETKKWFNCSGNYQYIINCRSVSSICLLGQKFYLFGGQYITSDEQPCFLNDFYEIQIKIKNDSNRQRSATSPFTPIIVINRIVTHITPKERGGHSLLPLGQSYLVLLGGQGSYCKQDRNLAIDPNNNVHSRSDAWIYSVLDRKWLQLSMNNEIFKYRSAFGACKGIQEQIYICGGMKNYDYLYEDLIKVKFNIPQIQVKFKDIRSQQSNHCLLCQEIKVNKLQWPFRIQEEFIKEIVQFVQFPFAAFGLLIDNSHMLGSTFLNISYQQKISHKINYGPMQGQEDPIIFIPKVQRYFRFQDNGKCFPNEELQNSLVNFQAGINFNAQGIDKKMKYIIGKQNTKRQFGMNFKLGALKLSESILYINILSAEEIRITLLQKQPIEESSDKMIDEKEQRKRFQYVCYYYCYNPQNGDMLHQYSPELKKAVQEKYSEYIQEAVSKKNIKNVLFLFELRKFKQQKAMYADVRLNDIIYGYEKSIMELEKLGVNIYQACDVSLRAFISCLYLKNQVMKITLNVCNAEKKEIPTQIFLLKIDKMLKNKLILDLTQAIQSDCKIIELYYNPDLTKKVNSFHNGVLLYHRNRLITRYDMRLGQTIKACQRKILQNGTTQDYFNIFNMFGYMQLPDVVPINIYKTDFIYTVMMEKLYSRLKYVKNFTVRKKKLFGQGQMKKIDKKHRNDDQSESDKSKQLHRFKIIEKKSFPMESSKIINKEIQSHSNHNSKKNQQQQLQSHHQEQPFQSQPKILIQQQQHISPVYQAEHSQTNKIKIVIQSKEQQPLKKIIKQKLVGQINDANSEVTPKKIQKPVQTPNSEKKKREKPEPIRRELNLRARPQKEDVLKNK